MQEINISRREFIGKAAKTILTATVAAAAPQLLAAPPAPGSIAVTDDGIILTAKGQELAVEEQAATAFRANGYYLIEQARARATAAMQRMEDERIFAEIMS